MVVALGGDGDHHHEGRRAQQEPAPPRWECACRARVGRHREQNQPGRTDAEPDPPRPGQAGSHEGGDGRGHPDAEREQRLNQEQRQPVQGRGGEDETRHVHTETEEVDPLAPKGDQFQRGAAVHAGAADAERLQDRATARSHRGEHREDVPEDHPPSVSAGGRADRSKSSRTRLPWSSRRGRVRTRFPVLCAGSSTPNRSRRHHRAILRLAVTCSPSRMSLLLADIPGFRTSPKDRAVGPSWSADDPPISLPRAAAAPRHRPSIVEVFHPAREQVVPQRAACVRNRTTKCGATQS